MKQLGPCLRLCVSRRFGSYLYPRGRLEENIASVDVALDASDLAELEEAAPVGAAAGHRYPKDGMARVNL